MSDRMAGLKEADVNTSGQKPREWNVGHISAYRAAYMKAHDFEP